MGTPVWTELSVYLPPNWQSDSLSALLAVGPRSKPLDLFCDAVLAFDQLFDGTLHARRDKRILKWTGHVNYGAANEDLVEHLEILQGHGFPFQIFDEPIDDDPYTSLILFDGNERWTMACDRNGSPILTRQEWDHIRSNSMTFHHAAGQVDYLFHRVKSFQPRIGEVPLTEYSSRHRHWLTADLPDGGEVLVEIFSELPASFDLDQVTVAVRAEKSRQVVWSPPLPVTDRKVDGVG